MFKGNSNSIKVEILGPNLDKIAIKLESKLEKRMILNIDVYSNSKFWSSMKL